MDNETRGMEGDFLARHTTDPALLQLLSSRESSLTRFTGRSTEVNFKPFCSYLWQVTLLILFTVERLLGDQLSSLESTVNKTYM